MPVSVAETIPGRGVSALRARAARRLIPSLPTELGEPMLARPALGHPRAAQDSRLLRPGRGADARAGHRRQHRHLQRRQRRAAAAAALPRPGADRQRLDVDRGRAARATTRPATSSTCGENNQSLERASPATGAALVRPSPAEAASRRSRRHLGDGRLLRRPRHAAGARPDVHARARRRVPARSWSCSATPRGGGCSARDPGGRRGRARQRRAYTRRRRDAAGAPSCPQGARSGCCREAGPALAARHRRTAADRDVRYFEAIARLKPGVTLAAGAAGSDAVAPAIQQRHPQTAAGRDVRLAPLREDIVGGVRGGAAGDPGRGRPGPADRLRQRLEPADRARDRAAPRARDPRGARRGARAADPPAARREPGARRRRRHSSACCSAPG